MHFNHAAAVARYQPRPQDAPPDLFAERIRRCSDCRFRTAHTCRVGEQLITVLARDPARHCPNGLWPNDPAEDVTETSVAANVAPPDGKRRRSPSGPAQPARVGFVTPNLYAGGVERWWLSLCREWSATRRVAIAGVALTEPAAFDVAVIDEARRFGPVAIDPAGAAAVDQLAACDVLIGWAGAALPQLQKFPGPVVCVAHGAGAWTKHCLRQSLPSATHLAAVSAAAAAAYPSEVAARVRVVWNGIDLDRCAPCRPRDEARAELGIAPDQPAIGYVGRWSDEKNPLAAAIAVAHLPGAVAVYASPRLDPAMHRRLNAVAGPGRWRTLIPSRVGDVYSALDCLVLCPDFEGGPLVALEAFAAGVPLVATPVGMLPELEARFGALYEQVPRGVSGPDLSAAVGRAIDPCNQSRRERARQTVWNHFSAARMARDWADFLDETVAGPEPG